MSTRNIESIYRLSPLQEGMLFHTIDGSDPGLYLEQYGCEFNGELDAECLASAWQEVAERHPVLRTLITWERRDRPLQIVRERVELPWSHHDWSDAAAADQGARWAALLARDRERGFDISQAPILRFALVRLAADRHRFLWSFHHALLDGWSLRIVVDEVLECYAAACRGAEAELPGARPYADFIDWLELANRTRAESFWRETLAGYTVPVCPDFGPVAQEVPSSRASSVRRTTVSQDYLQRLEAVARHERLTMNSLLLGAWALLLSHYTARDDVVFGMTVLGRPADLDGVEHMVGLFINTLPLRIRIDAQAELATWLRDVQAAGIRTRDFEQTPLVDVQRWSEVSRGLMLFETLVVFENVPMKRIDSSPPTELQVENEAYIEYSHFPLALIAIPGVDLELKVVYDPARFDGMIVDRVLSHLIAVLDAISEDPSQRVDSVSILPAQEYEALVKAHAGDVRDAPLPCVHELFELQAQRAPDAIALVSDEAILSYAELERRTRRLALDLVARGVGHDTIVPIFAERSLEAIVAIFATFRAGAGYALIDAGFPAERVRYLLDDLAVGASSGRGKLAPLVLVEDAFCDRLPSGSAEAVSIARSAHREIPRETPPFAAVSDPNGPAYVIYTSGSTGQPKGVVVSHKNLAHATAARDGFYPAPPSSYLLLSSIATDSAVAGIFWPIVTGGTLVIAPARLEQNIQRLSALIAREQVSHLLCLPSLYALILELAETSALTSLEAVIVAGEACSAGVVERHVAALPRTALYNEYGPAEGTVWSTATALSPELVARAGCVPIGRPIAGVSAYVLDGHRRPVPIGIAGELYIGGAGIAQGYWSDPDRSAEKFLPNPFPHAMHARLYRTGDVVRRLPDGAFQFLGRVDNQVKVRGYRVEPEEIESALREHLAVLDAAVLVETRAPVAAAPPESAEALCAALEAVNETRACELLSAIENMTAEDVARALADLHKVYESTRL